MLALVLAFTTLFSVRVFDTKSVVTMDTVSAVLTMSELRAATVKLEDYAILRTLDTIQTRRHVKDSTALALMDSAYKTQVHATDSMSKAFKSSDSARKACVVSAGIIDKQGRAKFWTGLGIGAGGGIVLSALMFVAGIVYGSP